MRVLGLIMVRDVAPTLKQTLDGMAEYCDAVFVLDDRSHDASLAVAKRHSVVANVFRADPDLSDEDWFFSESQNLNLLYKMADFWHPDWITRIDADEYISPGSGVRERLGALGPEVAGVQFDRVSTWDDPGFPLMIPLMGSGRYLGGAFWRYYPGLKADKPLHNPRLPKAVRRQGELKEIPDITLFHSGWNTLQKRIERIDFYTKYDPDYRFSFGKRYDKLLLFGYGRDDVDRLISTYRRRLQRYQRGRSSS